MRVIIKGWEEGRLSEWSAVSYPDDLLPYIEAEFKGIKKRQAELLGMSEGLVEGAVMKRAKL
jgi:hypothetical protein